MSRAALCALVLAAIALADTKQLYHCTGLGSCRDGDVETVCYAHDEEAASAEKAVKKILAKCKEALERIGGNWTCTQGSIKCTPASN